MHDDGGQFCQRAKWDKNCVTASSDIEVICDSREQCSDR